MIDNLGFSDSESEYVGSGANRMGDFDIDLIILLRTKSLKIAWLES